MPPRSSPTLRVSCFFVKLPKSSTGTLWVSMFLAGVVCLLNGFEMRIHWGHGIRTSTVTETTLRDSSSVPTHYPYWLAYPYLTVWISESTSVPVVRITGDPLVYNNFHFFKCFFYVRPNMHWFYESISLGFLAKFSKDKTNIWEIYLAYLPLLLPLAGPPSPSRPILCHMSATSYQSFHSFLKFW